MNRESRIWNAAIERSTDVIETSLTALIGLLKVGGYDKEEIKENIEIIIEDILREAGI